MRSTGKTTGRHVCSLLVEQTKGQSALSRDLARETEARRRAIDDASPQDDASWIRLWPVLRGIVAESVSGDVIDHEGEDLLKTMLERRESLEGDLSKHEAELKGEAKHLHNVIVQEIRRQKARIDLLSRAGEGLAFGKVTGVRIRCSRREDLLEKLQHVALEEEEEARVIDEVLSTLSNNETAHLRTIVDELSRPEARDPKVSAVKYFLTEHRTDGKT